VNFGGPRAFLCVLSVYSVFSVRNFFWFLERHGADREASWVSEVSPLVTPR
jgi:hypothetical protein